MFSKSLSAAAVLLAASLVSAQTFTECNPLQKTCPADPAFGSSGGQCDFTKGDCSAFETLPGTTLTYNGNGAVFSIKSATDAPTVKTGKYIFFGRVDVVVQAAPGAGIVTSAVLQSDDLDEIDWEWVGGDNAQAQSNYFSKGDTSTYNRGAFHPVANPTGSFHTYSVVWTSQGVQWLIDNNVVRTLTPAEANNGANLPQTPMQVKLGTWVAGRPGAPQGTVEWAGGMADFSKAPFLGYYKSISIVDYAGADGPTDKSVREYIYKDHSGSWESIEVVNGDGSSSGSSSSSAASSSKASSTQAPKTSSHAATSTEAHKTTAETSAAATSTSDAKTTFATASATSGSSSGSGSGSGSSGNSTVPSGTGSGASHPSTVPHNAAGRSAVAVGSVVLGAGALLAQFFL